MTRRAACLSFVVLAALASARSTLAAAAPPPDPLIQALSQELDRGVSGLALGELARPHYLAYWTRDLRDVTIQATFGSLTRSSETRSRVGRIDLRVGDATLDSSGFLAKDRSLATSPMLELPLDDDPLAVRRVLWYQTDRLYKSAAQTLESKKAFLAQKSGELRAPDFTTEPPVRLALPHAAVSVDVHAWEKRVRDLSAIMRRYPTIEDSDVVYFLRDRLERLVSSEGSQIKAGESGAGVEVSATAMASDGMELQDFEVVYGTDLEKGLDGFFERVRAMASRLSARTRAPLGEDYLGPVLLEEQAACEFLGQTLAPAVAGDKPFLYEDERFGSRSQSAPLVSRLNRRVLPVFLSVTDDPHGTSVAGVKLLGGYAVDQEGMPPEKVTLVDGGILKGLLTTRAPQEKIRHSNGHARAETGLPGARISNMIVSNAEPMSQKGLRKRLLDLVKTQELPYGIVIRKLNDELLDARGGRGGAQLTTPVEILRLHPDGREEEIRGMVWGEVGIHVLRDILAAGERPYVYNYYQSGRGGTVLCSISSPALLLDEVELKAVDQRQDRPPVLPAPLRHAAESPSP